MTGPSAVDHRAPEPRDAQARRSRGGSTVRRAAAPDASRRRSRTTGEGRARADEARRAIESGALGGARAARRGDVGGLRAGRPRRARRHPPAVLQPLDPRRHRRSGSARFGVAVARVPLAVGAAAASAARSPSAPMADVKAAFDNKIPFYNAGGQDLHRRLPEGGPPEGEEGPAYDPRSSPGWRRATSRSTRSACTSAAACRGARARSGSSARATARSTTGSARRRAARRPAASTASRSRCRAATSSSTPASSCIGPPIGTNTTGPEPGRGALCLSALAPRSRVAAEEPARMSFRTILIILNLVAFAAIARLHRLPRRQPAAEPGARGAREPHAVLRRRGARGRAPRARARCRADRAGRRRPRRCSPTSSGSRSARPTADDGFKERVGRARRGAVRQHRSRRSTTRTKSLLCANCHGVDGGGGAAPFVVKSDDPRCDPNQTVDDELADEQPVLPAQAGVVGGAQPPARGAALLDAQQLTQIITYGRPGTPMPAWGVLSGKGVLNEQSIQDLVNYVESIATTPDKAQAAAARSARLRRAVATCVVAGSSTTRGAGRGRQVGRRRRRPSSPPRRPSSTHADAGRGRRAYDKLVQQKQETSQVAHRVAGRPRSRRDRRRRSCS